MIWASEKVHTAVILKHNSVFDIVKSLSLLNQANCQIPNYAEESLFFLELQFFIKRCGITRHFEKSIIRI